MLHPRIIVFLTSLGLMGFTLTFPSVQAQSEKKKPVPKLEDISRSLQALQSTHQAEWAKAKDDANARVQLAQKLFTAAAKKKLESSEHFAHLKWGIELAAQGGDIGLAFSAIEELALDYEMAVDPWKVQALSQAEMAEASPEEYRYLVERALFIITRTLTKNDFALARKAGQVAERYAKKAKDLPLVLAVRRESRGIEQAEHQFAQLQPFLERLEKDPTDSEANLKMGVFQALSKGQWDPGLYYLAQGKDKTLRLLAQRDLIKPTTPEKQRSIGDQWWKVAKEYKGQTKIYLLQRAVHWYEQMVHTMEGPEQIEIQERIALIPPPRELAIPWDYFGKPGLIKNLGRHNSSVYGVAFSKDGKRILSGSLDRRACIWDAQSQKKLLTLQGHGSLIWNVAYGPRNRYVYTAGWDGIAKMWDARTGKHIRDFSNPNRIDFNGLDVSPDGRTLLTGSDDGVVRLWDVKTGKSLKQMRGHGGLVYGVAFSPDGRKALTGGGVDRTMILWDLKTGKALKRMQGFQGQLRSVAFSPDGRTAVGSGEQTLRLWDLRTGKVIREFRGHNGQIYAVAFSPDGRRLITGAIDNTIRYWDVSTGKQLHGFNNAGGAIYSIAFSPGGGRVVSGGSDNSVRLWGLPR